MAEEVQKQQYTDIADDEAIGSARAGGDGDFEQYVILPEDEALAAHVFDVKNGERPKYQSTEMEERIFIWFELDSGEGKGQRYRWDCKPTLTEGKGKKASNFDELMMKLVGKYPKYGEYRKKDIIGLPIRIELTAPKEYSGRQMQFVSAFKKPLASQTPVKVEAPAPKSADVAPQELMSQDEIDKMFS